jgi:hypothetical protein
MRVLHFNVLQCCKLTKCVKSTYARLHNDVQNGLYTLCSKCSDRCGSCYILLWNTW